LLKNFKKKIKKNIIKNIIKKVVLTTMGIAIIKTTRKTFLTIESTKGDGLRHLQV
jgi:hypothetical protein